jgi:hypothetical protein
MASARGIGVRKKAKRPMQSRRRRWTKKLTIPLCPGSPTRSSIPGRVPVDVKQHNWMSLSEAYKQLQEKFRGHHSLLDELLSNAIASGLVLVRGVPQFETLPVMIDGQSMKSPTRCNIRRGTLDLKCGYAARWSVDYHFVEIAWLEVDQYIHACALPSVSTPRPSEAAVRHAFRAIVEQYGRKNILKRGELDKELRDRVPGVTSKQCRDVRFWAIDQGILPAIATRPGRPRKSLRKGC